MNLTEEVFECDGPADAALGARWIRVGTLMGFDVLTAWYGVNKAVFEQNGHEIVFDVLFPPDGEFDLLGQMEASLTRRPWTKSEWDRRLPTFVELDTGVYRYDV